MKKFGLSILAFVSNVGAQTLLDSSMLELGSGEINTWQRLAAPGYPTTQYEATSDGDKTVLKAISDGGATGYWLDSNYDLNKTPNIRWSWKIIKAPTTTQAGTKDGDDFAARLFIGFDHASRPSLIELTKRQFAKATFGRLPPRRSLIYVWQPKNSFDSEIIESPYNTNTKYIVLTEGQEGSWLEFERNVLEDYRAAFKEEPAPLMGVGIMTDTDNSKGSAEALYGVIERY